MNLLIKLREAPKSWFFIALILNGFGFLALYSISTHSDEPRFVYQLFWFIAGVIVCIIFLGLPRRIIHKYAYLAFVIVLGILFVPYLTGPISGTYRWIKLGGFSFQPAEMMKWVAVIALARYLSDHNLKMKKIQSTFLPIIIILIPTAIITKQPDLGSAIILFAPLIPMLFWVGTRPFHIFLLVAPIISILTAFNYYTFSIWIIIVAVVFFLSKPNLRVGLANFFINVFIGLLTPFLWGQLKPYQQERVLVLLDVTRDPRGAAYQVIQSQTAIGSGGFLGRGWGEGTQTHLKFLPEQETDFIFSVIGEELGFVVVFIILILFAFLIIRMIKASFDSSERFSSLILIGIATIFLSHIFVNVGMTVNLLPVKGLPLPFLSYGGSFLVSCYAMIGLALNMTVESVE